jgi:hypothetical protein
MHHRECLLKECNHLRWDVQGYGYCISPPLHVLLIVSTTVTLVGCSARPSCTSFWPPVPKWLPLRACLDRRVLGCISLHGGDFFSFLNYDPGLGQNTPQYQSIQTKPTWESAMTMATSTIAATASISPTTIVPVASSTIDLLIDYDLGLLIDLENVRTLDMDGGPFSFEKPLALDNMKSACRDSSVEGVSGEGLPWNWMILLGHRRLQYIGEEPLGVVGS